MNDIRFSQIIDIAIESLPSKFKTRLRNVSIRFDDWPSSIQIQKAHAHNSLLLGLYEGIPNTKSYYQAKLPDIITLFKYPLMLVSRSYEEFESNVRNTLLHEIGHHFGMNEEEIRYAQEAGTQPIMRPFESFSSDTSKVELPPEA